MEWGLQTVVQVVLVLGGISYVIWGGVTGDAVRLGIGVLAVAVGLVGLARDRRLDGIRDG